MNFEQMFLNTVEGLEAGGAKLQHVQFVSGEAGSLDHVLHKACIFRVHTSPASAHDVFAVVQAPNGTVHDCSPFGWKACCSWTLLVRPITPIVVRLPVCSLTCSATILHISLHCPSGMGRTWALSKRPVERTILAACRRPTRICLHRHHETLPLCSYCPWLLLPVVHLCVILPCRTPHFYQSMEDYCIER